MLESPFNFFRGTAALMIQDIAPAPITGLIVQACGDAHLSNFGVFASTERQLIFGINDFDETYPGAWEWDLKRLAASVVVAGRYLSAKEELCRDAVQATVQSYCRHLQDYGEWGYLDLWYELITEDELLEKLPPNLGEQAVKMVAKAKERDRLQVLSTLPELVDEERHIIEAPPSIIRDEHLPPDHSLTPDFDQLMQSYFKSLGGDRRFLLSRYRFMDAAQKTVGVASIGTRCWVVYLEGVNREDPLLLQVKEAQRSVLEPYAIEHCQYRLPDYQQGHRVIIGQRLIQGAPDIFLGWGEMNGVEYYFRQLRDLKGRFKLEPGEFKPNMLDSYGELCGWALALAHAKSGDAAMMAGYLGKGNALAEALAEFEIAYADQVEQDYEHLRTAAKQGRLPTVATV
jgi:uncharacterized protein (DUF2252 family)